VKTCYSVENNFAMVFSKMFRRFNEHYSSVNITGMVTPFASHYVVHVWPICVIDNCTALLTDRTVFLMDRPIVQQSLSRSRNNWSIAHTGHLCCPYCGSQRYTYLWSIIKNHQATVQN